MDTYYISGGISGAITNMDTEEAYDHAIKRYMFFRSIDHDIIKISHNTGIEEKKIRLIKQYLFLENIITNEDGEPAPFDPSFAIADSWNRLAFEPKNIKPHDRLLLDHELYEMSLYFQGYSQEEAHELASRKFDYPTASENYYQILREKQKRKPAETPITITSLPRFRRAIKAAIDKIKKEALKLRIDEKNKGR